MTNKKRHSHKRNETKLCNKTVIKKLEEYLETIRPQIKQSTYGVYRRYIENHIANYFGNMKCNQLNLETMQGFINKHIDNGLSAVTIQPIFLFIKKGLEGSLPSDIFDVKLPKRLTSEVDVFSFGEQKCLEIAAGDSDEINRMGIILCLYTGIRIGELCGLMWNDIDFGRKLLYVNRTIQRVKSFNGGNKTQITFQTPKSNSSKRKIPLPQFLGQMFLTAQ